MPRGSPPSNSRFPALSLSIGLSAPATPLARSAPAGPISSSERRCSSSLSACKNLDGRSTIFEGPPRVQRSSPDADGRRSALACGRGRCRTLGVGTFHLSTGRKERGAITTDGRRSHAVHALHASSVGTRLRARHGERVRCVIAFAWLLFCSLLFSSWSCRAVRGLPGLSLLRTCAADADAEAGAEAEADMDTDAEMAEGRHLCAWTAAPRSFGDPLRRSRRALRCPSATDGANGRDNRYISERGHCEFGRMFGKGVFWRERRAACGRSVRNVGPRGALYVGRART